MVYPEEGGRETGILLSGFNGFVIGATNWLGASKNPAAADRDWET